MIPQNGQGVEERRYSIPSITKGPSKDNSDELYPKEALMDKPYTQGTKGPKKEPKIITESDPALPTRQVTDNSRTPPPKK